jgi:tRNA A37 methylthiotransferase MiaB
MEILGEPWMARHLHIALQHTSDRMLEMMHRRNRVAEDLELFERIAERGYAIGTDFIVGHPGESQEIFEDGFKNLRRFPITHIHLFTYSKRDGTPAAAMKPQVPGNIAKERYRRIKELVDAKNLAFRQKCAEPLQVLVESKKERGFFGHDQFYNPVYIKSELDLAGNWVEIKKYEAKEWGNVAKL